MAKRIAKKIAKRREWTKEDVGALKTLAREKTKTTMIARKLKRSVDATRHKASTLGVTLGEVEGGRRRERGLSRSPSFLGQSDLWGKAGHCWSEVNRRE